MQPGNPLRRKAGIRSVVALALACAFAPAAAPAAPGRAGGGDLSPRLAELAKRPLRSASPARQARAIGLAAEGPGSLLREGNRVLVEVRFEHGTAAGVDDLRAAGAKVVNTSRRYQTVTVAAKPAGLRALSAVPGVSSAQEVLTPIVSAAGDSQPVGAGTTPCFGAATSEGDEQLRADIARAEFEVDGSGVEVGILSDSFDQDGSAATNQAEDVASGDLPGAGNPCGWTAPIDILEDFNDPEAADEGRGMAQIVHDLAPGASLAFATAFTGLTAFAENIEDLRDAGADVIVDDVTYFNEPFFQEGPVGAAVGDVAAGGVNYYSSAGNNNLIGEGRDFASWEAPQYRDSAGCPAAVVELSESFEDEGEGSLNPTGCMDFDPGAGVDMTFGITVSNGATLLADLQWAEPWYGVEDDIDAYLLGPKGAVVAGSIDDNVFGSQQPYELVGWENDTGAAASVQLVVNRYSGANDPRIKLALLQNGGGVTTTEYESSSEGDTIGPTIFGHNGATDATSTGAIRYNSTETPEKFSSRGPVTHYFGPTEGVAPAAPLEPPDVLAKPDLVATDGGANTFFGACSGAAWRFFGTSAAAPHAAAIAALEREAKPTATAAEVGQAQRDGALPVGEFAPEAVGAGRIDAVGAIEALGVSPSAPGALPSTPPAPISCLPGEPEEPEGEPGPEGPEGPEPEPEGPEPEAEGSAPESGPVGTQTSASGSGASPLRGPIGAGADRVAPRTFFKRRPRRVVRTRRRAARAVFRFGSNEAGVTFLCKFDQRPFRRCLRRTARRFRRGRHVVRVKARDRAGNVDRTPAVYRFRVERAGRR